MHLLRLIVLCALMAVGGDSTLLHDGVVYLAAAVAVVPLFHRLKLGSVLGYLVAGAVDLHLLAMLLIGSIPGIVLGARLTMWLNETVVQRALAVILFVTGLKLILS